MTFFGTEEADILSVVDVNDQSIRGLGGDDTLTGGNNTSDQLLGDAGNDTLRGGGAGDTLIGGADHDSLFGDGGTDSLHGEAGNDTLNGGSGQDILLGGADNDVLIGGSGNDILSGGTGTDQFRFLLRTDGLDSINDFKAVEGDKIQVSRSGYGISSISQIQTRLDGNLRFLSINGQDFARLATDNFSLNRDVELIA